ncbi:hypothetical protein RSAG8_03529, partial [Rhizoctonia solani AG-8 WAC10335]
MMSLIWSSGRPKARLARTDTE